MATLVLKLPPLPDPEALKDALPSMTDEAQLIQSMRGVTSTVSMLIPAWHFLLAAETAYPQAEASKDYPQHVKVYFMKEAMLDNLLVSLRRIFDKDERSLALSMILRQLSEPSVVEKLRVRSKRVLRERALDNRTFDARVDILKIQCGMHLAPDGMIKDSLLARVGIQAKLVHRAANKRTAHMTLDDYAIGLDDLHQLISNVLGIAKNIHGIIGDDAGNCDHEEIDRASYEASKQMFGVTHAAGLITADRLPPRPSTRSAATPHSTSPRGGGRPTTRRGTCG